MKKLFVSLLAVAALVACNKNEVTTPEQGGREIRFTSNFSTYNVTKAASVLDGKTVKIFAGAPINANTTAEANDSQLTPATTLYWNKDQTETTTFASIYPADVATTTSFEYGVGNGDFAYHSAVLTAAAKDVAPESTVNFTYKHPFAMLKVTVNNNLEGTPDIAGVDVTGTYVSGTLDIAEGTVSNLNSSAVTATTLDGGKYCIVLLPQTARPSIAVHVGDPVTLTTYRFVITSDVVFEANKFYNVTLTLDESTPPVVQGSEVAFGFTVADWEAATDEIPVLNVTEVWSVVGEVNDSDWSEDFDMTYDAATGICTITGVSYKAGINGFKLRKAHDWSVSAGLKDGVSTYGDAAWDGHLDQTNNNIKLAEAGVYTLTFKPEDYTFTATKTGDVATEPVTVSPWKVVGLGGEWDYADGITMTETNGVWEADITFAATDSFKLFDGTTWAGMQSGWTYYGLGDFASGYLNTDGGAPNIVIGEGGVAGNYHLAFTPATLKFVVTENNVNP